MSAQTAVIPWYLYIIKTASGSLYTGITVDVLRRFEEHSSQSTKTAKALRGKGPFSLAYCVQLTSHSDALKAELWIKKQSRANKLKMIGDEQPLPFEHKRITLPLPEHKDITE
ncbi:GIY-YIG nuclease family protein [Glaciecola sp. SC05]|uniref:GIY-YIG nuclease family protein n=1 Tax=Glaciecola sp. SC05 TaxID=1987355 RepID=UPI003526FE9F